MKDKQGISRGRCTVCSCTEYITPKGKVRCKNCDHAPTKHEAARLRHDDCNDASDDEAQWESVKQLEPASPFSSRSGNVVLAWDGTGLNTAPGGTADFSNNSGILRCQFPGCSDVANFDLNTGQYTSTYCHNHLSAGPPITNDDYNVPPQSDMMALTIGSPGWLLVS